MIFVRLAPAFSLNQGATNHQTVGSFDSIGAAPPGGHGAASKAPKDDEVIKSLVTGALPPASSKDAANPAEERRASSRHAREQIKRLLQFVKKQLAEDLSQWRGGGEGEKGAELTDQIGRQRALASKLEGALHELMGSPALAMPSKAAGGGGGFTVSVTGASLPRTVAVNDSTVRPVLLASGPATRWTMRPNDAPPSQRPKGGEDEEINLDWQAGEVLMLVIEAVDETGAVDDDFDAVVLLDCEAHVQGRGLVRVTRGRGYVPLLTSQSGEVLVQLQDGGYSAMEQPPSIRVNFKGSAPALIAFVAESNDATAGDGVQVQVEARDRFQNIATDVSGEVKLFATHGATWGDEPVLLEQGVAIINLVSETAANVQLTATEVMGGPSVPGPDRPAPDLS